jgi:opacity protein-like surface antigen
MHRKATRYVTRSTAAAAGTLAAAATCAAAAALAASIILSPAAGASARLDGVHADLARAVQLNQVTEEQAARFEARLAGRILGEA